MTVSFFLLVVVVLSVVIVAAVAGIILWLRCRTLVTGIGFIHPTAGGGGGGERVLWLMIDTLARQDCSTTFTLYTKSYPPACDSSSPPASLANPREALAQLVSKQFDVSLPPNLRIVLLDSWLVGFTDPKYYPRFTLILQSLGSALAIFAAVAIRHRCTPVVYETVGIPFLYPLLWCAGVRTRAYVHYPVISTDMIARVDKGETSFNNASIVARNRVLSIAKLWYYRAFAALYRCVGRFPETVFTNSTWTNNHIRALWPSCASVILYPPCDVSGLLCAATSAERMPWIVSVAQFRPEKNHLLQLQAFAAARRLSATFPREARLILIGGARNAEDRERVEMLKRECVALGIEGSVDFKVSCPYDELRAIMKRGLVGLHSMVDEHFGIVVVEYLAAGCMVLAHNSGGVKLDIARKEFAWLATSMDEYAASLVEIFQLWEHDPKSLDLRRGLGQGHAATFSDQCFATRLRALTASTKR